MLRGHCCPLAPLGVIEVPRVQLSNGLVRTIDKPTSLPAAAPNYRIDRSPTPRRFIHRGRPQGRCRTKQAFVAPPTNGGIPPRYPASHLSAPGRNRSCPSSRDPERAAAGSDPNAVHSKKPETSSQMTRKPAVARIRSVVLRHLRDAEKADIRSLPIRGEHDYLGTSAISLPATGSAKGGNEKIVRLL